MLENQGTDTENNEEQYNFYHTRQALESAVEEDGEVDGRPDLLNTVAKDLQSFDAHDTDLAKVCTTRLPAAVNASLPARYDLSDPSLASRRRMRSVKVSRAVSVSNGAQKTLIRPALSKFAQTARILQDKVISLGQRLGKEEQGGADKDEVDLDEAAQELVHKAALDIKALMTQNSAPLLTTWKPVSGVTSIQSLVGFSPAQKIKMTRSLGLLRRGVALIPILARKKVFFIPSAMRV